MRNLVTAGAWLLVFLAGSSRADEAIDSSLKTILSQPNSPAARSAWTKLTQAGPAALPAVLAAMDTPDTVAANWLRTAFDQLLERALKDDPKSIDAGALLGVVQDAKRQGRVRQLALDVVEQLQPGTRARLTPGWLDDPVFRYESVVAVVQHGERLLKKGDKEQALAVFRKAFAAVRDVQQTRQVATHVKDLGSSVSVYEHLGALSDWYVIGPFDAMNLKGFKAVYPPEQTIDLQAEYAGKNGKKLKWKRFTIPEPPPTAGGHIALLRFPEPLGDAIDAVGYAYTVIDMPETREVEFRGSADDNLTVFVNGTRVFGFEEYSNGVRLDRHRFKVNLKAGLNTILVKVCQGIPEAGSSDANWEFFLRIVDDTAKGVAFRPGLPAGK